MFYFHFIPHRFPEVLAQGRGGNRMRAGSPPQGKRLGEVMSWKKKTKIAKGWRVVVGKQLLGKHLTPSHIPILALGAPSTSPGDAQTRVRGPSPASLGASLVQQHQEEAEAAPAPRGERTGSRTLFLGLTWRHGQGSESSRQWCHHPLQKPRLSPLKPRAALG